MYTIVNVGPSTTPNTRVWRSIPINVTTPLILENGIGSKGYPRWTLSYRRGFSLWSQEAEYERRFLWKTAPAISFPLPGFVKDLLPYILSNFGENRCRRFWENWGNSSKIPRRISRVPFELQRPHLVIWSRTLVPTRDIFFRIFGQGVEKRGRFQFSKKSAGGKRLTNCRVALAMKLKLFNWIGWEKGAKML